MHLLSQIEGTIVKNPIAEQAPLPAIEAQAHQVADLFAGFAASATETLDICIYDFRLVLSDVSDKIVAAINGAAGRGVTVRVAYDANEASDAEIIKQFAGAGGDPAPTGTQAFLTRSLHDSVQAKAIAEVAVHERSRRTTSSSSTRERSPASTPRITTTCGPRGSSPEPAPATRARWPWAR